MKRKVSISLDEDVLEWIDKEQLISRSAFVNMVLYEVMNVEEGTY